jgi:hypothetical protein
MDADIMHKQPLYLKPRNIMIGITTRMFSSSEPIDRKSHVFEDINVPS